jgi:leucyl-tRNA---protein transferase
VGRSLTNLNRHFFTTAPLPCPYLPGRRERRLVTDLSGSQTAAFHDLLSQAGFRRSHGLAYVPICPGCNACVAVRVKARHFQPTRTQRRIWRKNIDISVSIQPARATDEQFALFRDYQLARHEDSEMSLMDFHDYRALVETTPVETIVLEFRDETHRLVAACLTDCMADGYSAVYSFFAPELSARSLGTFIILSLIDKARAAVLPHVYLGFWIAECRKMAYKTSFQPFEVYADGKWEQIDRESAETLATMSGKQTPRRTPWPRLRRSTPE